MDLTEDFDAFVTIVDSGSISEAARRLDVPRASLSRQLSRLEARLRVRLVNRTTRVLVPTPAGVTLYAHARRILDAAEAAVEAVQRMDDVPRGLLRLSAAPLQTPRLGELIGEFTRMYPEVEVELVTGTEFVDLTSDPVDVAIRGGLVGDPNLIARPLLSAHMIAVASPAYLEEYGVPETPQQLSQHRCLRGFREGTRAVSAWPLLDGDKIRVEGPVVSNDIVALLGAVIAGAGIAMLPKERLTRSLLQGRVQPVLEDSVGLRVSLSLVWREREFLDPKVRAFIDLAVQWAKEGRLRDPDCDSSILQT